MELQIFKTLWGRTGSIAEAADQAVAAGFCGLESSADLNREDTAQLHAALQTRQLAYIQEIVTAGNYVPRRDATVAEHVADAKRQMYLGMSLQPSHVTIIGGCDAWTIAQSVSFFSQVREIAASLNINCSFETHRSRSLFNPWTTLEILHRLPELQLTCDFSHWVVVMERQLSNDWEMVCEVARHAKHIHARVGYDQGPQVPHPAAPEYQSALEAHQRCWEAIWNEQHSQGCRHSTMTPEFGPDGYMHTLPYTQQAVADLWEINRWMASTEQAHFQAWRSSQAVPGSFHQ